MTPDATTAATADTGTEAPNLTSGTDDNDKVNPSQTTKPNDAKADDNSDKTFTQADVNRILARESKKAVEAALALESKKKAEADLSETERERKAREEAEAKAFALEERVKSILIHGAVLTAASDSKLGARDAQAIAQLVKAENLELDGDNVKGVDAELARLKKAHPALFYTSTADGNAGTRVENGTFDFNAEIRRRSGRV